MYDILDGTKEQEKVLHRDSDPSTGFVLLRVSVYFGDYMINIELI